MSFEDILGYEINIGMSSLKGQAEVISNKVGTGLIGMDCLQLLGSRSSLFRSINQSNLSKGVIHSRVYICY